MMDRAITHPLDPILSPPERFVRGTTRLLLEIEETRDGIVYAETVVATGVTVRCGRLHDAGAHR